MAPKRGREVAVAKILLALLISGCCAEAAAAGQALGMVTRFERELREKGDPSSSEGTVVLDTQSCKRCKIRLKVDSDAELAALYNATAEDVKAKEVLDPKPERDMKVAICLTGQARDFELTGPSLIARLLPAYPGTHVFLNVPLDAGTFKFHALASAASNVTIAAVKVTPLTWVDASAFPQDTMRWDHKDPTTPFHPFPEQTFLQQFKLVQGCVGMIRAYEIRHGVSFDWVMRTRADTFWQRPPPPLSRLPAHALTFPYGSDWNGINDRLTMGPWGASRAGMSRLDFLGLVHRAGWRNLSSETQLFVGVCELRVPLARAHFPFCIVSRKQRTFAVTAHLGSATALNGADCRPCTPWREGAEAERALKTTFMDCAVPGPITRGITLCDGGQLWEDSWQKQFDAAVGPALAHQREQIQSVGYHQCVSEFSRLKARALHWHTVGLSPTAVCVRRYLGRESNVGATGRSFYTFLNHLRAELQGQVKAGPSQGALTSNSSSGAISTRNCTARRTTAVIVTDETFPLVPVPKHFSATWRAQGVPTLVTPWEMDLRSRLGNTSACLRIDRHTTQSAHLATLNGQAVHALGVPSTLNSSHTLVLGLHFLTARALISQWQAAGKGPSVCQLLAALYDSRVETGAVLQGDVHQDASTKAMRSDVEDALQGLGFQLGACIQEPGSSMERCTFFSTDFALCQPCEKGSASER